MKKILLIFLICAIMLSSCQKNGQVGQNGDEKHETASQNGEDSLEAGQKWGILMDSLLRSHSSNACVSPLAYKLALACMLNGAENGTADLIEELINASQSGANDWAKAYFEDISDLESFAPNTDLIIANSLWLKKSLIGSVSKEFAATLSECYKTEIASFDKLPDQINSWVLGKSKGKIEGIIEQTDPKILMYLVSAAYFNGLWANEFTLGETFIEGFDNIDGSKANPEMMHGFADAYFDNSEYTGMAKYLYGGFKFIAVMPKEGAIPSFDAIAEAALDFDGDYSQIKLSIPKFSIVTENAVSEATFPELSALFAPNGMKGALIGGRGGLSISEIIHKTKFSLNEYGIEASAASSIESLRGAQNANEPKEVEIVFDKPFYFLLTDMSFEPLLFGKVGML